MNLKRIISHLLAPRRAVIRAFPRRTLAAITDAVRASEELHNSELRFAVEGALYVRRLLRGESARQRAQALFSKLRVWDTEHNSGVLIYVQLVDRRIEIIADRGINAKVEQSRWNAICRQMEAAFKQGQFEVGVLKAIEEITALLVRHFPPPAENPNELPDKPIIL